MSRWTHTAVNSPSPTTSASRISAITSAAASFSITASANAWLVQTNLGAVCSFGMTHCPSRRPEPTGSRLSEEHERVLRYFPSSHFFLHVRSDQYRSNGDLLFQLIGLATNEVRVVERGQCCREQLLGRSAPTDVCWLTTISLEIISIDRHDSTT